MNGFPENMKSKKALCFNFNGFNLSEFNGGIGGKIWLTDKTVFVTSLDFDHSKHKYDMTDYDPERTSTSSYIELKVGIEKHVRVNNKISPYIGVNTGIGYDLYENERADTVRRTNRLLQNE